MSKTTYERGKTLTYPSIYPTLTFTPIFGHRGDFVWIEEVKVAWPEHDSEFTFVRSTMHDERVDRLKAENAKLREYLTMACEVIDAAVAGGYNAADSSVKKMHTTLKDLGIEVDG